MSHNIQFRSAIQLANRMMIFMEPTRTYTCHPLSICSSVCSNFTPMCVFDHKRARKIASDTRTTRSRCTHVPYTRLLHNSIIPSDFRMVQPHAYALTGFRAHGLHCERRFRHSPHTSAPLPPPPPPHIVVCKRLARTCSNINYSPFVMACRHTHAKQMLYLRICIH